MKKIGHRCNKLYIRLGINRDASPEEIKMAYRNKAKTFHPDVGGDKDSFSKVVEAYQVLSDPYKRQKYDQTGHFENSGISEATRAQQAANDVIATYFQSLCNEKKEQVIFIDIIASIKEKLRNDIQNTKQELKKVRGGLKVINELLGRIEYKGKTANIIEGLTLKFLEEHENAILKYKEEIKKREMALKLLKDYGFNPMTRQPQYATYSFTTTSSSSW